MEALYAALPSRNRELWALISLTEAMAQAEGLSGPACAQERGALAYQVIATWCQASPLRPVLSVTYLEREGRHVRSVPAFL